MAARFIYEEMNEVGKTLFGYELLPEEYWPAHDEIRFAPKESINLYHEDLDYSLYTSLYCFDYMDISNDCPKCPFSKFGGCNDTPFDNIITTYNNWRSVPEIVTTLSNLNGVRSHLVIAMLNDYIDRSYEKPILLHDEERGYNVDDIFYFGHNILFEDVHIDKAMLDNDILYLPFEVIDISDITIPMVS